MEKSAPEDTSFHHTQIRQKTLVLLKGSGQDCEIAVGSLSKVLDLELQPSIEVVTAALEGFATTELNMKPFESPDDALPAPLPEGGATEISGSCAPRDQPLEGLDSEAKKIELHERLTELRDEQD